MYVKRFFYMFLVVFFIVKILKRKGYICIRWFLFNSFFGFFNMRDFLVKYVFKLVVMEICFKDSLF